MYISNAGKIFLYRLVVEEDQIKNANDHRKDIAIKAGRDLKCRDGGRCLNRLRLGAQQFCGINDLENAENDRQDRKWQADRAKKRAYGSQRCKESPKKIGDATDQPHDSDGSEQVGFLV